MYVNFLGTSFHLSFFFRQKSMSHFFYSSFSLRGPDNFFNIVLVLTLASTYNSLDYFSEFIFFSYAFSCLPTMPSAVQISHLECIILFMIGASDIDYTQCFKFRQKKSIIDNRQVPLSWLHIFHNIVD